MDKDSIENREFSTERAFINCMTKDNRKRIVKRWLPIIMLCVGAGLIIAGLLIELGVIC